MKGNKPKYGTVPEKTLDYGDEDPPPSYDDVRSNWSISKIIAVVGFIIIQLVLIASILNQLYNDKLNSDNVAPEQVHLSLGKNDREYYVSWSTIQPTNCHLVWYKNESTSTRYTQGVLSEVVFGEGPEDMKKPFKNEFSEESYKKYFYSAKMTVEPGSVYYYFISSKKFRPSNQNSVQETIYQSDHFHFKARPYSDAGTRVSVLFYGDMGLKNAQSVPLLKDEVLSEKHDLIIHNGDFAYDLNTEHGRYGDEFMNLIQPIAAKIPYQTSVGNHEVARNFSHYDKRFKMINGGSINHGNANNFYYSFNVGPVHFVAFSTEFYYFLDYAGIEPLVSQYDWLVADLSHASSAEERLKRPWIVVYGHRPMYCSSRDSDDCSKDSNLLRKGLPFTGAYALEKLFYEFGVDVELYSHEHQYERFLPIYDGQVYNGTDKPNNPYHNARGPVHLISGSAGCQEKLDPFIGKPVTGSVRQIADYGYTRIRASRCEIHFEQVSDDKGGSIVDEFALSKNRQNFPYDAPGLFSYSECRTQIGGT